MWYIKPCYVVFETTIERGIQMQWKLVADSSCDLAVQKMEMPAGAAFATVPLKIIVGDQTFVDDHLLDVKAMRSALETYKGKTSSACPSPEEWAQEFREADQSIAVAMTSALSGTYNSARVAREMVLEEEPNKKIHVIDTKSTAGHMVLLCRRIRSWIEENRPFEEICAKADELNRNLRLLFTLQSFETLVKNGRMNKLVGLMATRLHIRAVGRATEEGELGILKKARGEEKALTALVDTMEELSVMNNKEVFIHHSENPAAAEKVRSMIEEKYSSCKAYILPCRGLTSYYAEKGGVLVGF